MGSFVRLGGGCLCAGFSASASLAATSRSAAALPCWARPSDLSDSFPDHGANGFLGLALDVLRDTLDRDLGASFVRHGCPPIVIGQG